MAPPTPPLSVPAFLKLLTTGGVGLSTSEAMGAASALIKAGYNKADVANPFVGVSEISLVAAGVTDFETRKQLVAYGRSGKGRVKTTVRDAGGHGQGKKRKGRESDLDRPLPVKAEEREALSLDFEEVMEDYLLHDRSLVINRAPVMTAWATIVAERLGFNRQEALSIAHTYTNMNATAKGVSLGIYSPEKGKQRTTVGPSQPYVELMGRKIPMLALQSGEWRGIANGAIAEPEQAFGYIQRSFRQHMSAAMGALRLLADTIDPDELNKIGFNLYAEFRPEVQGWGERGQLHLGKILDLRRGPDGAVKVEEQKPTTDGTCKEESANESNGVNEADSANVDPDLPDDDASPVKTEPVEPPIIDSVQPASEKVDTSHPKLEEDDVATIASSKKPHITETVQAPSMASPPPAKKVKLEAEVDEEDWDDGGINDDDLAALV